MAHGNPIYHICYTCNQYILNGRFNNAPVCPDCNNISKQIDRYRLKEFIKLPILDELSSSFTQWTKFKLL